MAAGQVKVQERQALFAGIWKIADKLRGAVSGAYFQAYVLGMLFYRYLSEDMAHYFDEVEHQLGDTAFRYAALKNRQVPKATRQETIETKGYYIQPEDLLCNVLKEATEGGQQARDQLNVRLSKVFAAIERSTRGQESEEDFQGLFSDIDLNSNNLGGTPSLRAKCLFDLLQGVSEMTLGSVADNTIDAFGDAYEYLLGMYAANAGKSGGEFFTPQEVSNLLTRLATVGKKKIDSVYDPACGSGSLLLQAAKILGKKNVSRFYGQEINNTTQNLCRINMFLHGIGFEKFDIQLGNTLTDPKHLEEGPFDVVVSNPPYSIHWEGSNSPVLAEDPRFAPAGALAPDSKADLAFVLHALSSINNKGAAAIVCFPGIFYRGGAERTIRKYLVEGGYVDAVIQLPDNLFYGTTIATCILVMRRRRKKDRTTLFIDGSHEFEKVTNNNHLTPENIETIVRYYTERQDAPHRAKLATAEEIAAQDYNLSVSTYVPPEDTRETIDITALEADIARIVTRENELRTAIDALVADLRAGGAA